LKLENISTYQLNKTLKFDGNWISTIRFDLNHINYGWNKIQRDYNYNPRSYYSAADIVIIFEQVCMNDIEWTESNKLYETLKFKSHIRYIAFFTDPWLLKNKKIVIDIEEGRKQVVTIVTIY